MDRRSSPPGTLDEVLLEELRFPFYLTEEEVQGGWREIFPKLAKTLGSPYPIYCKDEKRIVMRGYPVLLSAGVRKLQAEVEGLIILEVDYRIASVEERESEKRRLKSRRTRYGKSLEAIIENTLINDYGRGLFDIFLLFHSDEIARSIGQIPNLLQRRYKSRSPVPFDRLSLSIAGVFGDLIQESALTAMNNLKQISHAQVNPGFSTLLGILCQDQLLFLETRIPSDISNISAWVRARLGVDAKELKNACEKSAKKLRDFADRNTEVGNLITMISGIDFKSLGGRAFFEPRLLDAIEAAGLAMILEIPDSRLKILRDLGIRLKRFEFLLALRRRVLKMERNGTSIVMVGKDAATPIAPSTRPFDFAAPGVISSAVQRFGLIYDLTSFTQTLEEVRKKGRLEEEKALRFMYIFQSRLEEIRSRRRLNFEKFLGDGAFYSARRGLRVLAAACEIQFLYDELRRSGFPFDLGMRIAINFGSYQLLPMWTREPQVSGFEFFGHGIVELARLSTGKSTRELEQIADFLIYSGYDPPEVDAFLGPLMQARGKSADITSKRSYSATLDPRGELINEGIVLTLPFLKEIELQIEDRDFWVVECDGLRWVVFEIDPGTRGTLFVGLRHMGVARLKGLEPTELIEAIVWPRKPRSLRSIKFELPFVGLLRRFANTEEQAENQDEDISISEDLVVLTFKEIRGRRRWIFGEYRASDDVLLHAIHIPLKAEDLSDDDVVEVWLLKNRFGLAQIYESLRRESSGLSTPLAPLRKKKDYVACFLSAPHRAPE